MGKIWIEVCIISARGLRRSSSFWKLQWFTIGWIDPDNKYCTKIDASGSSNSVWKTKFAAVTLVDESNIQDMVLHVEVYSREPIFLREKLQGTASVALKKFLAKYNNNSTSSSEEVGSYQLRKRNSNKPQGFVDISIRISKERENPASLPGNEGGLVLMDHRTDIPLSSKGGYPVEATRPHNQSQMNIPFPYKHPVPYPTSNYNPSQGEPSASGPGYRPPRSATPPPPPPPSNVGYIPTFLPRTETYMNMPSSVGAGVGPRPGFAIGVRAGALAAGAMLFGDDFMSGFDVPAGFPDPTLAISTDPPF
ncbi:hypothetical protein V6Z11_D04G013500 [Gossypium hirsutum]|uniref:C2 domain-containing protein n=1 Tax=Gossypium hirsutum TaxID=3635 RepID=A0ABM2ZY29_GOSHI|nr:uncharacterized protein LOC107931572 [Gossypium hirsutum]